MLNLESRCGGSNPEPLVAQILERTSAKQGHGGWSCATPASRVGMSLRGADVAGQVGHQTTRDASTPRCRNRLMSQTSAFASTAGSALEASGRRPRRKRGFENRNKGGALSQSPLPLEDTLVCPVLFSLTPSPPTGQLNVAPLTMLD